MSSTVSTTVSMPALRSVTGSLLANPVAASTAPCWSAAAWPYSGYSTIVTSSVVRFADPRRAWSMIHDEPYLPGVPIFLPLRSAAVLMPESALARTTDGNWP